MRLAVVAPTLVLDAAPGVATVVTELTREFLRQHSDVRILLCAETAQRFPEWQDHVDVVTSLPMRPHWRKGLSVSLLESTFRSPACDVSWFPTGAILPFRFRGAAVSTLHDTLEKDVPSAVPLLERVFRKLVLGRTTKRTRIATASRFSRDRILRHHHVLAEVIVNGYSELPAADFTGVPVEPFVFYPGRDWEHKNHSFLLETWRQHRELSSISLVFTLGGEIRRDLAKQIASARNDGIRIHVLGRIPGARVHALFLKAHCTVVPSLYEGFGLVVQEALGAGCPALVAPNGSLPETVTKGYPFLLPLESALWAKTIAQGPRNLGLDWRSFSTARPWERAAEEYLRLFRRVFEDSLRS